MNDKRIAIMEGMIGRQAVEIATLQANDKDLWKARWKGLKAYLKADPSTEDDQSALEEMELLEGDSSLAMIDARSSKWE